MWTAALRRGVWAVHLNPLPPDLEVRFPYYGDLLDKYTVAGGRDDGSIVVARGPNDAPDRFQAELLAELAERAGVSRQEIAAKAAEPAVSGIENWAWTQATGRALCRRAPWLAEGVLRRFLTDVDTYLRRPVARRAVNALIRAEIAGSDGPVVVVGHSLGSVVCYDVLDELGSQVDVPLFVTLGSPLGIEAVKRRLTHPLGMPAGVARWVNVADDRDPHPPPLAAGSRRLPGRHRQHQRRAQPPRRSALD